MVKIPLKQIPSQKLRVVLDGQNCTIELYYRFGNTYLNLYVGNTIIEKGAICRNRASIIKIANSVFSGSLHFLDLLSDDEPYYKKYNDRFILLYVSADEELPKGLVY